MSVITLQTFRSKGSFVGKYDPLRDWLSARAGGATVSLDDIAQLVGGLPETAYRRAEWWSNDDDRRAQVAAWLSADMEVARLDLSRRIVWFVPRSE